MLTGLFMAFWWNTSADEYAITDEIFLMSMDHDIEKVNGLNQQLSNVIDYTLEWMENQKNNLKKKKGWIHYHACFIMEMRMSNWSYKTRWANAHN